MRKITLLLVMTILLAGCDGLAPVDSVAPTEPADGNNSASVETPDAESEMAGSADEVGHPPAETNTPVIPASTSLTCVPPSEHPDLAYTGYEEFPQAILDYLNAGASPEELAVWLIVQNLGPKDKPVWAEDLTGDGVREVAVTVINEQMPPQGALLIYNCQDGQYVLNHTAVSSQDAFAPQLHHIQDINGDGQNEVVYSIKNCGAHTCFEDVDILVWQNGEYESRLEGSTLDFPYPEIKLTDFNHDGVYALEVVGTTIASVGAGPQRDSINVWSYDPASGYWTLSEQTQATSPFRVHLMHDAEAAMDRGEYLIAGLLFQQVIEDDTYLEWANPESEYNNLAAYAYYKQIVASVYLGDRPAAEALFAELQELYDQSDQYAYVDLAQVFLAESEADGLEAACTAAREFAAANLGVVLSPLGSAVYGYANPELEPADVCP